MGTVDTGTLSQLLLKISLQISAGCCWAHSRMKVLLLAAVLVSQVVGRPQQGEYQPGNGWSNTRPAQPTQWSAWSSVGGGAPTSYNSYDSYNSYNPYNSYDSYVPGGNKQPYLRSNSYGSYIPGGNKQPYLRSGDSVSGSVGGPIIQDIGLNNQGSLPNVETTRGDMGEPQMGSNVDGYQGWNTLPARPSFDQEPSFPGGFPQPSSPCSGGARPSPCGTGRCPSPWGGACASACSSPCSQPQPGPGPMPQPLPYPMPAPMPQPQPLPMPMPQPAPMPMPVPMPQPMQPGNCGSGGCGQMPQPSRCQLGSGPQMGPLLGPIATTGCGGSDRDMPTYGAPSNGWMPGNSWMTKPWPQQPAPMPMPMPEPMPSGNCGPGGCGQESEACNSCGK